MSAILVRRGEIESATPPAGRFRSRRYGGGAIPPVMFRRLGVHCVDTADRVFALTYDDGPDPATTPRVLDVLRSWSAAATFFVLVGAAQAHPDIIRRMIDDGHEIGLHGADHRSILDMTTGEARTHVRTARDKLSTLTGRPVRLYRPPYGEHSLAQARMIRRLGLDLTMWSGDAHDWVDGTEDEIAGRGIAAVFPGAILLLHDTRADPEKLEEGERLPSFDRAEVLERILTATRAEGYTERTVGDLLNRYPQVKTIIRERMVRT